ncbi:iron uptake porin [Chamaesiphon sp. OTE_75_metabat_556]|uniref:iron uptake porin n=1 Tax=Chamaesiphon sp. OTE_75_metabat_556 TaxID=2964692 RepID=UPI00286BA17D|nr:iron uptake porin [Chamaesiphon sp. OTE_75_metabat_556]
MNDRLNWFTITVSGLIATLLFASDIRAVASIPTTANRSEFSAPELIAIAARKKNKKRIVRKKVRIRTQVKPATTSTAPTTSPTDVTQTPPTTTPVTPPPAPAEPSVTREEVEALRRSNQELREELIRVDGKAAETTKKVEQLDKQQFSLNTKLQGQVIFGATGTFGGDYSRNTAFGHRTRLELKTEIGSGTLTTRLQAVGLGLSTQNPTGTAAATNEGSLSWTDGTTNSSVGIDALKYEFPLTPQTQVVVAANAGAADDFADTINPYFDGDGASGSISAFGNRPSIYYTVQGQGVGIRHKLNDTTELSLGYLARAGNDPATGSGLLGGDYGALAQISFKTGENSKVGLTYTRTFNSDPGTGSSNANLGGISSNYGVQGSFQLSPQFALGGWVGYTQNQASSGDRQIWNWAITAAAPDLGGKGNLAGFLVGQEPRVTASGIDSLTGINTTDTRAGLHIEGFYQFKVSDSISITPGIIYLTAPNQDANSSNAVIGAVRTTFTF